MSALVPRLDMQSLDPRLAEALGPRVKRLGYLGEFFKCTAHQPAPLLAFMHYTDALKEALPERLTEVVALTVAAVTGNAYERNQHERLSERLGFGRGWVAAVIAREGADGTAMSPTERSVQALCITVLDNYGSGLTTEFDDVVRAIGHVQAIAVLMLIGRYASHAIIVNTLGLAPPAPSIFADE